MDSSSPDLASKILDVIIVGGGPAGSALAITLANLGRQVLLLEKHAGFDTKLGESLPPVSIGAVKHYLGDIDQLVDQGIVSKTMGNVSTWSTDDPEVGEFFFTPAGYGLCVNRVAFDALLRQRAMDAGATVQLGSRFRTCERIAGTSFNGWKVEVSTSEPTSFHLCRYLVDCSGRSAVVATALGISRSSSDDLFACARRYESAARDEDRYTRIEATEDGWFYSNLLTGLKERSERIVVFHADKSSLAAKMAATSQGFTSLLNKTKDITRVLSSYSYQPVGRIRGACAASERLERFAGGSWAAVGDAAQAYDPLSSQGIYKALVSANQAGQLVHYALNENQSAPGVDVRDLHLQRYVHGQEKLWAEYGKHYSYYYQNQSRWADQPFWCQRQYVARDNGFQYVRDGS